MKPFPADGGVLTVNLVWQRGRTGEWERHLVRQLDNGDALWSRLVHVEAAQPVCLHCLSNNVSIRSGGVQDVLLCGHCGVSYTIV